MSHVTWDTLSYLSCHETADHEETKKTKPATNLQTTPKNGSSTMPCCIILFGIGPFTDNPHFSPHTLDHSNATASNSQTSLRDQIHLLLWANGQWNFSWAEYRMASFDDSWSYQRRYYQEERQRCDCFAKWWWWKHHFGTSQVEVDFLPSDWNCKTLLAALAAKRRPSLFNHSSLEANIFQRGC